MILAKKTKLRHNFKKTSYVFNVYFLLVITVWLRWCYIR